MVELKSEASSVKKMYKITKLNIGKVKFTHSGIIMVSNRAPITKSILNKKVGDICKLDNSDTSFEIIRILKVAK